ncbi:MAG: hypothetical protein RBT81_11700 [Gammaproteobacteria bacterium]|jgi:hypothetical protein|nr:hypothetical protein [Gammaproteobacteria bacterium]
MKLGKCVAMLAIAVFMSGCGGHGYEGEYESKAGSSIDFMNAFAGSIGSQRIVIGSDYIESQGNRLEFEKIFVRQSGKEQYLVFKDGKSEEAWKILDDGTLMQGNDFMEVNLVRVK